MPKDFTKKDAASAYCSTSSMANTLSATVDQFDCGISVRSGDVSGMAKKGNVLRVMLTAFSNGFMWQTVIGAWW